MQLNTKFISLFGVLAILSLVFFFIFPIPAERAFFYYGIDNTLIGIFLVIIGIITLISGIMFYLMLYSPEKIKGFRAEYTISPDLTTFESKPYKEYPSSPNIPEEGYCSACGKHIFRPYRCNRCGQILCGTHILPGNHRCGV